MKIGKRVRRQRNKLGFSLRELAARADLTAGFLSQLENDQISPSLNSLQNIATALQVPMFYFLENSQPHLIVRAAERRKLYFPDSHMGYDLLAPELTRQMMPMTRVIMEICVESVTFLCRFVMEVFLRMTADRSGVNRVSYFAPPKSRLSAA